MNPKKIDELWEAANEDIITYKELYDIIEDLQGRKSRNLMEDIINSKSLRKKMGLPDLAFDTIKKPSPQDLVPPEQVFFLIGFLFDMREQSRNKKIGLNPFKSGPVIKGLYYKWQALKDGKLEDSVG